MNFCFGVWGGRITSTDTDRKLGTTKRIRLVCFPVVSAADSGLRLSGRVDVLLVVSEELVMGGGVVLGASCAMAGMANAIAKNTSQYPYRAPLEHRTGPLFDAAGHRMVPCADEAREPNRGSTDSKENGGGIKLSRGKFNAPEREV
jgi:hypothetical protein